MAKSTITKTNPDKEIVASINEIFTKFFGPKKDQDDEKKKDQNDEKKDQNDEKKNDQNESSKYAKAIQSLSFDEKIALCAYVGRRMKEFNDLFSAIANDLNSVPTTNFPDENALFSVKNADTGEIIGGLSVRTETETTYSTASAKGRTQVLDALKAAGLTDKYTNTKVALDNKKLATDKENKTLPDSVSNVFSVKENSSRVTEFQKLATEQVEE